VLEKNLHGNGCKNWSRNKSKDEYENEWLLCLTGCFPQLSSCLLEEKWLGFIERHFQCQHGDTQEFPLFPPSVVPIQLYKYLYRQSINVPYKFIKSPTILIKSNTIQTGPLPQKLRFCMYNVITNK